MGRDQQWYRMQLGGPLPRDEWFEVTRVDDEFHVACADAPFCALLFGLAPMDYGEGRAASLAIIPARALADAIERSLEPTDPDTFPEGVIPSYATPLDDGRWQQRVRIAGARHLVEGLRDIERWANQELLVFYADEHGVVPNLPTHALWELHVANEPGDFGWTGLDADGHRVGVIERIVNDSDHNELLAAAVAEERAIEFAPTDSPSRFSSSRYSLTVTKDDPYGERQLTEQGASPELVAELVADLRDIYPDGPPIGARHEVQYSMSFERLAEEELDPESEERVDAFVEVALRVVDEFPDPGARADALKRAATQLQPHDRVPAIAGIDPQWLANLLSRPIDCD